MTTFASNSDSFEKYDFYQNVKTMPPQFYHNLNLYDNNIYDFLKGSKNLIKRLEALKACFDQKLKLQEELKNDLQDLSNFYCLPSEEDYVHGLGKLKGILSILNRYEFMMSEQLNDLSETYRSHWELKNAEYKDSKKKLKEAFIDYKTTWSVAADYPNITNIKDPVPFQKASVRFLLAKKVAKETSVKHITLLDSLHTDYKLWAFKNISSFFISINGFFSGSLQVFHASWNELKFIYEQTVSIQEENKEKNNVSTSKASDMMATILKDITNTSLQFELVDAEKLNPATKSQSVFNKFGRMVASFPRGRKVYDKLGVNDSHGSVHQDDVTMEIVDKNSDDFVKSFEDLNYEENSLKKNEKPRYVFELYQAPKSRIMYAPIGIAKTPIKTSSVMNESLSASNILGSTNKSTSLKSSRSNASLFRYRNEGSKKTYDLEGYLRLRIKSQLKNDYKPLYFLLCKEDDFLYSQGFIETRPVPFVELSICSVKVCRPSEVDRNFCFKINTPYNDYILQAEEKNSLDSWVKQLCDATMIALGRLQLQGPATPLSDNSSTKDSAQARALKAIVNKESMEGACAISRLPGNEICADCNAEGPEWTSINLGITICINCSGIHRSLGVHISKVRSLTLDHWNNELIQEMIQLGNQKVNACYEAKLPPHKKPTPNVDHKTLEKFIYQKYVEKKFFRDN